MSCCNFKDCIEKKKVHNDEILPHMKLLFLSFASFVGRVKQSFIISL
jgi:hypothetical protein